MKRLTQIAILAATVLLFSSCGVNNAFIANHNQNATQVHLSKNNYKVVEKVTGSAEVDYVLFIGGLNQRQLFENAYADMVDKANLMSGSKALINVVTESYIGGVPPFYYKRVITVSAYVIEFTE